MRRAAKVDANQYVIVERLRSCGVRQVLAIDPGYERSAAVLFDGRKPLWIAIEYNANLLRYIRPYAMRGPLVIEQIESYGMAVGREVFETVHWAGRLHQAWSDVQDEPVYRMPRRRVKLHLCGSARAKDANVRQALIDRFGPDKATAVGTKKAPGPLYGVKSDLWAALAVAVTWWDEHAPRYVDAIAPRT